MALFKDRQEYLETRKLYHDAEFQGELFNADNVNNSDHSATLQPTSGIKDDESDNVNRDHDYIGTDENLRCDPDSNIESVKRNDGNTSRDTDNKFFCDKCTAYELKTHERRHPQFCKYQQCPGCFLKFSERRFDQHWFRCLSGKLSWCQCRKCFGCQYSLKRHQTIEEHTADEVIRNYPDYAHYEEIKSEAKLLNDFD